MQSKNNPLVSVVIPAYNEDKHIEECLQSVKSQTYKVVQLVVVNDGSIDATERIAKKYADIFITQQHQGPGVARNLGAKKSAGDILVFIDADMYLDKDYIKNIIKPIVEHKASATFTKEEYVANPENIWSKCFSIDNNLPINRRIPIHTPSVSTKFRAIDRAYFFKVGGYKNDTGYGEDEILTTEKAIEATGAICYHYNPNTLRDVFYSARWLGRSKNMYRTFKSIARYSIINSMRISFRKMQQGAPIQFLIYKLVFDFGITCGLIKKNIGNNFAK